MKVRSKEEGGERRSKESLEKEVRIDGRKGEEKEGERQGGMMIDE